MSPHKLDVRLQVDPPGILEIAPSPDPHIIIHFGAPVEIRCERGGQAHMGVSVHGDIDIVPAGVASQWILKKQDTALIIRVAKGLLTGTAGDLGIDPSCAALRNRFQVRDPQIEHLGWALKTELDHGFCSGRLYLEGISTAMACRLLQAHSLAAQEAPPSGNGIMSPGRLRRVLCYIEDNLGEDLSLAAIAAVSGMSISQCQRAFRGALGCSIHQYVIRRRVDRAKSLLIEKDLPISEIALAVGFAHQSHLSYHMRRLCGVSPMSLRKASN